MTIVKDGFTYSVELRNNSNEAKCSAALDNFVRSFTFLEASADEKK